MTQLRFLIKHKQVTRFLLITVFILFSISLTTKILQQLVDNDFAILNALVWVFDVDRERNIPAIYSSATLLGCAVILFLISFVNKLNRNRYFWHWFILSFIFLFLAWDEAVEFHEQLMNAPVLYQVLEQLGLERQGVLNFPWVIVALPIVFLIGVLYSKFFLNLPPQTKRLFLLAASLYIFGALGMEVVGGLVKEYFTQDSLMYVFSTAVEELLEMLGIVVFIDTNLAYLSRIVGGVNIYFKQQPQNNLSGSFLEQK